MQNLSGKITLITGAGKGIGRATAELFASRGAIVIAVARTDADLVETQKACQAHGGRCETYAGDVTDAAFVERVFESVKSRFARLDILVNNAGVAPFAPIEQMTPDDFRRGLEVNLTGVFLCMQQAVRLMKSTTREGKIINIGSVRSHWTESGDSGAYNASKVGLRAMTESVARELHLEGNRIAVGMVCPGVVDTTLTNPNKASQPSWLKPEEVAEAIYFSAVMPTRVNVSDITLFSTEQRPW